MKETMEMCSLRNLNAFFKIGILFAVFHGHASGQTDNSSPVVSKMECTTMQILYLIPIELAKGRGLSKELIEKSIADITEPYKKV